MKKIKGAIVGLGRMGITHYAILNSHPQVEISSICEESSYVSGLVKQVKNAGFYSNYQKMFENEKPDFIIVSTPVSSHFPIIKEAIERNIHVFCEKPFTHSLEEAQELVQDLEAKKQSLSFPLVNQLGYVNRYNSVYLYVKSLLENQVIGKVSNFSCEMNGAVVTKNLKSNWRSDKKTGGGCLMELGSHAINMLLWFFGTPQQVLGSIKKKVYSQQVDDIVHVNLLFQNGVMGWLSSNWSDESLRKVNQKFEIQGLDGKIIATSHFAKIFLKQEYHQNGYKLAKGWNTIYHTDIVQPVRFYLRGYEFTSQLDDFIDAIVQKRASETNSFHSGLETDRVIHTINQNALEI